VLVPLGGWLGDKISRKWILTLTVAFWSVATMCTGLCNSFIALVIMRSIATGGGEALFGPNYNPLLAEYHSKTRAVAMALVQIAYYLGIIASGWLAGWIGQEYGWRATFIVFGAVGVVHGLIMAWRLKDKYPAKKSAETSPKDNVSLLDGFRVIFTTPTACFVTFGFASLIFVLTGYLTWMPTYMHENFNISLADAGFQSMLWTHCFAAVGVLIAGRAADKFGTKRIEWRMYMQGIGLILAAPFILLMGNSTEVWLACVGLAGFGFFRALFDANTYVVLYDVIPTKYHSSAS
jgi:MFS family permease